MSRFTSGLVQNYLNNLDPPTGASGGASGPAGGDLIGNFPNPFLIPTGVSTGTYGDSSNVAQVTVDAKGRITNIANVSIPLPSGGASGPAFGDLTGSYPGPFLIATGVVPGIYGDATNVAQFQVDSNGRLLFAGNVPITGGGGGGPPSGPAGGDLTGTYPNPTLIASGVFAATYGSSVLVPQFSVDSKGRITSVSEISIAFPPPNVVMDDGPVVVGAKYATQPAVEGCWFGYNTKQHCVADAVVVGNNCRGAFTGAVAVGRNCQANSAGAISVGENTVNGISSGAFGLFNLPTGDECYTVGQLNDAAGTRNFAFGTRNTVTGQSGSTAIGSQNTQSGPGMHLTFGLLNQAITTGSNLSIAMGSNCISKNLDTVIGFNSRNTGTGTQNLILGTNCDAQGTSGVALGTSAVTFGIFATAVGIQAQAHDFAVALGVDCQARFDRSICVGYQTIANNTDSIAVGTNSAANGANAAVAGFTSFANGDFSSVFGPSSTASGLRSGTFGSTNQAIGDESYVVGNSNVANNNFNYAFGSQNTVTGQQGSNAIGFQNTLSGGGRLQAHGFQNTVTGANFANAFGCQNTVADSGTAVGNNCQSTGGFCGGYFAMADILSVAIGFKVNTLGSLVGSPIFASVGIGSNLIMAGQYNVVLGAGCVTESDNNVVMGASSAQYFGTKNVVIGDSCGSTGSSNVIIGDFAQTGVSESICFGKNAAVVATDHALSFGLNAASITNASMNFRLNNTDRQIEAFTKLYQTFATAGGDTALSYFGSNSSKTSFFTGAANENVILPTATTGVVGYEIKIANKSTGNLSIWADAAKTSLVTTLASQDWGLFTIINVAANLASSWDYLVSAGVSPSVSPVFDPAATPTYPTAPQTEGIWYGLNARANCLNASSIVIGNGAFGGALIGIAIGSATANNLGIAIGYNVTATSPTDSSICIGRLSAATGANSIAMGLQTGANNASGLAIGNLSSCQGFRSSIYGYQCFAGGSSGFNFAAGFQCSVTGNNATAVGSGSSASAANAVAVGSGCVASVTNSISLGNGATVTGSHCLSFGLNSSSFGQYFLNLRVGNVDRQIDLYNSIYTTTVTTGGDTQITSLGSKKYYFTGTSTHNVILPPSNTGQLIAWEAKIVNNSTGAVSVWADAAKTILITTLPGANPGITRGGWGFFNCVDHSVIAAASWSAELGTTMI